MYINVDGLSVWDRWNSFRWTLTANVWDLAVLQCWGGESGHHWLCGPDSNNHSGLIVETLHLTTASAPGRTACAHHTHTNQRDNSESSIHALWVWSGPPQGGQLQHNRSDLKEIPVALQLEVKWQWLDQEGSLAVTFLLWSCEVEFFLYKYYARKHDVEWKVLNFIHLTSTMFLKWNALFKFRWHFCFYSYLRNQLCLLQV